MEEWIAAADAKTKELFGKSSYKQQAKKRDILRVVAITAMLQGQCFGSQIHGQHSPHCPRIFSPDAIFNDGMVWPFAHWSGNTRDGDPAETLWAKVGAKTTPQAMELFLKDGRWLYAGCHNRHDTKEQRPIINKKMREKKKKNKEKQEQQQKKALTNALMAGMHFAAHHLGVGAAAAAVGTALTASKQ